MTFSTSQPDQQSLISEPAWRTFYRAGLAACIVLAPLVLFLGFAFDPTGGVPPGGRATVAAFQAVSPLRVQLFLWFNAVTPYFFPLSYIGLGLLALRRSPVLATAGIVLGLLGSLPFGFFVEAEATVAHVAQLGDSAAFEALIRDISSEGVIVFLQISWVVGHLLGYLLLGIALIRARAIPLWSASLIILGLPFQAAAYIAHQGLLQLLCFGLIFIGSIPAAWALRRSYPDSHAATAPSARRTG
jgi:hypothetical protein